MATYVNPGWVNDTSPAVNAANLNNLSNAVVQDQTNIAALQTLLADYETVEENAGNVPAISNRVKIATNAAVATSAWAADSTYESAGYGYRASVAITGVTASYTPFVCFGLADAVSGNYAPVAVSYAGGVYIYAKAVPQAALTIPSIVCITA